MQQQSVGPISDFGDMLDAAHAGAEGPGHSYSWVFSGVGIPSSGKFAKHHPYIGFFKKDKTELFRNVLRFYAAIYPLTTFPLIFNGHFYICIVLHDYYCMMM